MDKKEINELKALVDEVMYASTKNNAKRPIQKLEFQASYLYPKLESRIAIKLKEVVSYAKAASGQVEEKEHWITCVEQTWIGLENALSQ